MAVLSLLLVELRAASLDSGGTQMCPRNDDEFLSALSAQEVEIVLSKTDEQDALTSWHLRFGLANRPFAVFDKPDESAHRPSKARHLLKHVSSNQIGRSGVGQSPTHALQFSPGEINSRAQSSGSDDVITIEVAVSSDEVPLSQPPWFCDPLTMVHNDFTISTIAFCVLGASASAGVRSDCRHFRIRIWALDIHVACGFAFTGLRVDELASCRVGESREYVRQKYLLIAC